MTKILIDGEPLEDKISACENREYELQKQLDATNETIKKLKACLTRQNKAHQDLQLQIINMHSEDTRERTSFWDFLRGNKKPEESSRLTESTVTLDK